MSDKTTLIATDDKVMACLNVHDSMKNFVETVLDQDDMISLESQFTKLLQQEVRNLPHVQKKSEEEALVVKFRKMYVKSEDTKEESFHFKRFGRCYICGEGVQERHFACHKICLKYRQRKIMKASMDKPTPRANVVEIEGDDKSEGMSLL